MMYISFPEMIVNHLTLCIYMLRSNQHEKIGLENILFLQS